ncbi:MAG: NAD-dependent dehydratase, partial [Deltaproteobacteria bacterium CG_4_10_14_3_um_filter_60_8]
MARRLLEAGKKVRAVGRTAARLEPLVKLGAEASIADIAQVDAVARALDGATAAYLMLPPNFGAEDFLGYQQSVVESMATAIQRAGVKHAVFLSSVGAHLPDGTGPITGLHRAEHRLGQIEGLNLLSLRPAYFMESLFMLIPAIKQAGVAGS